MASWGARTLAVVASGETPAVTRRGTRGVKTPQTGRVGRYFPVLEISPGSAPPPPVGEDLDSAPKPKGVRMVFEGSSGASSSETCPNFRRPMLNEWLSLEVLPGIPLAAATGRGEASGLGGHEAGAAVGAGALVSPGSCGPEFSAIAL